MSVEAVRQCVPRFSVPERVVLLVAAGWSVALVIGALTLPMYTSDSMSTTPSGTSVEHESTATLVDVNGSYALLLVAVPLLVTGIVGLILCFKRPERGTGPLAWTVVGLLAAFTLAAMLTIGGLILPVTGCLVAVCCVREGRRRPKLTAKPHTTSP